MIRGASIRLLLVAAALLGSPLTPSAAVATDDGVWSFLSFPPPSARVQHAAIYDPVRNRMLVFGGLAGSSLKNDVWELSLAGTPTWKLLAVGGTPPSPRRGASAIYDPVRDRMLVYGGAAPGALGDVWAMSLGASPAWTQLMPTGSPPPFRSGHSAIYDPVRDRMVVFGGQTGLTYRNDSWALALAGTPAWSSMAPSGGPPDVRARHSAIYDSVRDRLVIFGGNNTGGLLGDLWSFSFSGTPTWTLLSPPGTPPPARTGSKAIYDITRDRMILFGGDDGSADPPGTTWALPFASPAWSALTPSGAIPPGPYDHVAVLDTAGDRMLVFGGLADLPTNALQSLSLSGGTAWTALAPLGGPASPRIDQAAAYDPLRDRMIVMGGHGGGQTLQDAWALVLGTQTWVDLNPSGTKPSRAVHVMVYDSTHDRMLVFGGLDAGDNPRNDVWSLTLGATPAWTKLTPAGTPPPERFGACGVYDPAGDRLVIFGGSGDLLYNDVWALSLSGTPTWTQLSPSGTPPPARYLAGYARNPVTNSMVIFGGTDSSLFNDVWALALSGAPAWTQISASGAPPSQRFQPSAIYDQSRDRLMVFGGFDGVTYCGDTWALSLQGASTWTQLLPAGASPTPRYGHTAIYDSARKSMLVYGGDDGVLEDDTYELLFGDVTAVADAPGGGAPAAMTLHAAYPNPFRSSATIDYDLARSREGRIAVYDVHGRLVRELARGLLPQGSGSLRWDGTDGRGIQVAAGTYFYRIESEGDFLTHKVVLLR